jgi:hypothetical protein
MPILAGPDFIVLKQRLHADRYADRVRYGSRSSNATPAKSSARYPNTFNA